MFSVSLMWCPARVPEGNAGSARAEVVQWNMQWGGGRGRGALTQMFATLDALQPDVICLSEPATLAELRASGRLGRSGWHAASVEHSPDSAYWFRLTVLSRQPVAVRREWKLGAGHVALFEVALRPRTLRVLMVDLESGPLIPRSPLILEVARIVDELAAADAPVDVVAGDFNTPGRFLGFDALSEAGDGYRRAALWSGQWRATWPASIPLSSLDIDHLWVKRGLDVASAHFFSSPHTDHRGQLASLRIGRASASTRLRNPPLGLPTGADPTDAGERTLP